MIHKREILKLMSGRSRDRCLDAFIYMYMYLHYNIDASHATRQ